MASPHRFRTFIGVSLILGIIVALHTLGALEQGENIIRKLSNIPILLAYRWSLPGEALDPVTGTTSTTTLPIETRSQIALLQDENRELRRQLHFFATRPYSHVGAHVIGRAIEPFGNTIIINQGSNAGIEAGNPVIVGDGIIVGKVVKADREDAHVALINEPESKLAATVINDEKSIGLVEGGFGISVRMNFIPQNETIHVGDIVVSSGLEKGIPRGLVIGKVEAVEKEAYQPFQRAIITPPIALDRLTVVSVLVSLPPSI